MSSEEDDYMSDAFLNVQSSEEGLPKRKQEQRVHELYKKRIKAEENPPMKAKDKEQLLRETGLNTAISNNNKGFKMLEKMGYKPGTSLGKVNDGLLEPINIVLKNERGGLGKSLKAQQKVSHRNKLLREDMKQIEDEFKASLHEKSKVKRLRKFFYKAQITCEYLDKVGEVQVPVKDFFWPREAVKALRAAKKEDNGDNKADKEDIEDDDNKASEYHKALRIEDNKADEENKALSVFKEEFEDESEEEEEVFSEDYLFEIVDYLRKTYLYCFYCAAKGNDEDDLKSFCPGPSFEDHDDFD